MTNLATNLTDLPDGVGESQAIRMDETVLRCADLHDLGFRLAAWLRARGTGPCDRAFGIVIPDGPAFLARQHDVVGAGAAALPTQESSA
jgi:hypothetical protein